MAAVWDRHWAARQEAGAFWGLWAGPSLSESQLLRLCGRDHHTRLAGCRGDSMSD